METFIVWLFFQAQLTELRNRILSLLNYPTEIMTFVNSMSFSQCSYLFSVYKLETLRYIYPLLYRVGHKNSRHYGIYTHYYTGWVKLETLRYIYPLLYRVGHKNSRHYGIYTHYYTGWVKLETLRYIYPLLYRVGHKNSRHYGIYTHYYTGWVIKK